MNEGAYTYDVFISYRWVEPDKTWVQKILLPSLKKAGLKTCVDFETLHPSHNQHEEQCDAIKNSAHTLCIFSPEYFDKGRMTVAEAQTAKLLDPTGEKGILVPLMLRNAQLPSWLDNLNRVDWTNPEMLDTEWIRLLRALGAKKFDIPAPSSVSFTSTESAGRKAKPTNGGNYMIIPHKSAFELKLKAALLARKAELGIANEGRARILNFDDYKSAVYRFLDDDNPRAKWLFTVYHPHRWEQISSREEEHLFSVLEKTHKKIVFIEAGLGLMRRDHSRNIYTVRTDYDEAVESLLCRGVMRFLQNARAVRFVTLLGPRGTVADERRRLYNQFLGAIQCAHDSCPGEPPSCFGSALWTEVQNILNKPLQIVSLPLSSWDRAEACNVASHYFTFPQMDSFHTCFLCGNDEMALGAYDAMQLAYQDTILDGRMAFIGFDGIDEFATMIDHGLDAATACVDVNALCDRLADLVNNRSDHSERDIKVTPKMHVHVSGAGLRGKVSADFD